MGFSRKYSASPAIVPIAGERRSSTLQSKVRTHAVQLTLEASVDVTVDFTALRNRGSVLALYDEIGLFVDGEDRMLLDPRIARFWAEMNAVSALPATRASNFTAATPLEQLKEVVYLFMANPRIARPEETAFLERDTRQEMQVFAKFNGTAAKLFTGAGTALITAPNVRVTQIYDPFRSDLPLLRPSIRQVVVSVPAANNALEISLRGSRYIGAIVIQQDSDGGEVTDIINAVSLLGDDGKDIIPRPLNWSDRVRHAAIGAGGAVSVSDAYLGLNFVENGRLSELVHPYAYSNLRLVVDAQPSVVVGATNSKIRVAIFEYDRDTELTAAALPFTI
jgi:hypothetical protein